VPANRRTRFALALWLGLALAGSSVAAFEAAASQQKKVAPKKKEKKVSSKPRDYGKTLAVLKTSQGDVTLRLFFDKAPGHVKNFVDLSAEGFYDGTLFHRVIPEFMIQGGDPLTKDPAQAEVYGTGGHTDKAGKPLNVKAEFNEISHRRGVLSMARASDPDSASSQFFIVVKDSPFLDRQYTVFGEVVKGMDVVDRLVGASNSDTADPRSGGRPRAYQKILKVELVEQTPDK
jgi:peptidyl-prolyl cis-trans isomerase B (cyclophilin B)